jgi:hypothetical protein
MTCPPCDHGVLQWMAFVGIGAGLYCLGRFHEKKIRWKIEDGRINRSAEECARRDKVDQENRDA